MSILPAARVADVHMCPLQLRMVHGGGTLITGSPSVFIEGKPATRVRDFGLCSGELSFQHVAGGSATVKVNGREAARVTDKMFHGGPIVVGATTVFIGGAAKSGWTVTGVRDLICKHDPSLVDRLKKTGKPFQVMYPGSGHTQVEWNGTAWVEHWHPTSGYNEPDRIDVSSEDTDAAAVDTLFHEMHHQERRHEGQTNAQEYETETATAEHLLKHGFPEGRPGSRKRDASGKEVIDYDRIRRFVDKTTPPPNPNAKPGEPWIQDHDPKNNNARLSDKSERPPRAGDFYTKDYVIPRGPTLDLAWLTCPASGR